MPEPASVVSTAAKAAAAAARFRPWATARRNDRLALEEYEDLESWVTDTANAEADEMRQLTNELAARGMLQSGEYGYQLGKVRELYAQRWRDRRRASERKLATLRESEGVGVAVWRKIWRRPRPTNPHEARIAALTPMWEDLKLRRAFVQREVERAQRAEP